MHRFALTTVLFAIQFLAGFATPVIAQGTRDYHDLSWQERQVLFFASQSADIDAVHMPKQGSVEYRATSAICPTVNLPANYPYGFKAYKQAADGSYTTEIVPGSQVLCNFDIQFDGSMPSTSEDFITIVKTWCVTGCNEEDSFASSKPGTVLFVSEAMSGNCPRFYVRQGAYGGIYPNGYGMSLFEESKEDYTTGQANVCAMRVDFSLN